MSHHLPVAKRDTSETVFSGLPAAHSEPRN